MSLTFKNEEYNNILNQINKNNLIDKNNLCAICKEPLLIDTIDLQCNHRYHSECLSETFIKYKPKLCPLCNEKIVINSFKSKCTSIMKNKKICNRVCYNNESVCKLHTKVYLRQINK